MRVHWAALLTVTTLMTMMTIGSAGALAQIGGGSAGETGGLPEQMNSASMGSREHPMRVSSGVMASLLLHRELPVYPKGTSGGAMVMAATIDCEGKVATLKILSGPEPMREATLEAVRKWTYKPFLLNGSSVFVQTTITINIDTGSAQ
jgi:Gram-negative bacterial TonB protein C-terminal